MIDQGWDGRSCWRYCGATGCRISHGAIDQRWDRIMRKMFGTERLELWYNVFEMSSKSAFYIEQYTHIYIQGYKNQIHDSSNQIEFK